jgi:CRISPR-associated protein Csm4
MEGSLMIIYIEPRSSFRPLSSDTLYGAVVNTLQILSQNFDELLASLAKRPPFLISSAFPFVKNGTEIIHFFPKPITKTPEGTNIYNYAHKELKKAQYVHETIFNKWLQKETGEEYLEKNFADYIIKDGLLFPRYLKLDFSIKSLDTARNSLNRLTHFSDFFFTSGYYYKNSGLFFMVRFLDRDFETKYRNLLLGSFRFLSDRGFGGDVSVGKGHFEILAIKDQEIINESADGNRFISLSKYLPTEDEIKEFQEKGNLYYDFYTKRGRDSSGSIRKKVRFFLEGSTFPQLGKDVYGRSICVGEEAMEFGYSFNVRMRD